MIALCGDRLPLTTPPHGTGKLRDLRSRHFPQRCLSHPAAFRALSTAPLPITVGPSLARSASLTVAGEPRDKGSEGNLGRLKVPPAPRCCRIVNMFLP